MRERVYRFVRHADVLDFLALGWHICDPSPGHHGYYSALLVWLCECKMVVPK